MSDDPIELDFAAVETAEDDAVDELPDHGDNYEEEMDEGEQL